MRLKGKVALITGAAQGIGKAIAKVLAGEGADIIVSDINLALAEITAKEIAEMGVKTMAVKTNVADFADVERSVAEAVQKFSKIDILVNNAGITKDTLILRMKPEDWKAVIDVNLTGVFNCIKSISSLMVKQRSGKIINIASIVGEMGNFGQANYAASKGGVIALTKTAAKELAARTICVNAVAPGFIQTAMTDVLSEDVKKAMMANIPLHRFGQPEEVANAVLFLSSSESDYITGQVINVNGGMLMNT